MLGFGRGGHATGHPSLWLHRGQSSQTASLPQLLPSDPVNHTPNDFVFTDETFLPTEASCRWYLPLIVPPHLNDLYQEMGLNFQLKSRSEGEFGTGGTHLAVMIALPWEFFPGGSQFHSQLHPRVQSRRCQRAAHPEPPAAHPAGAAEQRGLARLWEDARNAPGLQLPAQHRNMISH